MDECEELPTRRGRVTGNLPQEITLMRVIAEIENPHYSWSAETPASKWDGVSCESTGEIYKISWKGFALRGKLRWELLPEKACIVEVTAGWRCSRYFSSNFLTGVLPTASLPNGLHTLDASYGTVMGHVDLCTLPPELLSLSLNENYLEGPLDFTKLPASLLFLSLTSFSCKVSYGVVDFTALPKKLTSILLIGSKVIPKDGIIPDIVKMSSGYSL